VTSGLVDIILPTQQRPHTLGYAIQAVIAQTYRCWRLHVVCDGCDKRTEAVVRSFGDDRIAFYRFPKAPGYGYAHRNTVLRQTDGEFVAYATDDDLWLSDHLATGIEALRSRELALVAFRSALVAVPDRLDPHFFAYDWRTTAGTYWLLRWFVGAVECVHRRSVFDAVGYWNDQLFRFGDREFHNRVRGSGVLTEYRDHITVLRFYAAHWDRHYAALDKPPQSDYVVRVTESAWRDEVRKAAQPGRRSVRTRLNQFRDFMQFGVRSGPKFARFWFQKWRYGNLSRSGE
jgi:glycosyltransferase involved in cell wall biosynthesis